MCYFRSLSAEPFFMKNIRFAILILVLLPLSVVAQKFGYVDTDYILRHMPEYSEAQEELNRLSGKWQIEIEDKYEAIRLLEQSFQAEKILLTSDMRTRREEEILNKRIEAQQLQKAKFGVEGELFQRREELIKPVQDALYEAIQELCTQRGYMVIFDKSNQSNMLYTNPKYDLSDDVVKKLGYKPGETIEKDDADERDQGGAAAGARGGGSTGAGARPGGNTGGRPGGAAGGRPGGGTVNPRGGK